MEGTITSFDGADGLGWIELDSGDTLRFGLSACKSLIPRVGMRVMVVSSERRGGRTRATHVQPILDTVDVEERVWPEVLQAYATEPRWIDGVQREVRVRYQLFERDGVRGEWPAAAGDLAYAPAIPAAAPPRHELFAPWHDAIVATGVGALKLSPVVGGTAGMFGGVSTNLDGAWPTCREHGPMALIVSVAAATIARVVGVARRLTVHACVTCLNRMRNAWVDEAPDAIAVEWSEQPGALRAALKPTFERLALEATPVLSLPHAWTFLPRRDVAGHFPVGGVAPELFAVKVLRDRTREPQHAYDEARFVYDRHYAQLDEDLLVGGYANHRFARCRTCASPLRQLLHINDYFSEDGLGHVFEGSRELTLLACDRTAACGGPVRGLVALDP